MGRLKRIPKGTKDQNDQGEAAFFIYWTLNLVSANHLELNFHQALIFSKTGNTVNVIVELLLLKLGKVILALTTSWVIVTGGDSDSPTRWR